MRDERCRRVVVQAQADERVRALVQCGVIFLALDEAGVDHRNHGDIEIDALGILDTQAQECKQSQHIASRYSF